MVEEHKRHKLWMVMDLASHGSCHDALTYRILKNKEDRTNAYFSDEIIATILKCTLEALKYLHEHGMIHRDIKASETLLFAKGVREGRGVSVDGCVRGCA
jgi:serine/threonine-protein kinase OSR1/STK39